MSDAQDQDWNLIYMPNESSPKVEGGWLPTVDVLDLTKHPDEKVRRLAQEAVVWRWRYCEESQGSE